MVVFDKPRDGIVIMRNSSNGEGIYKELLETLLGDTFTPIEWEGFAPYNEAAHPEISVGGTGHDMFPESELRFFSKTLHIIANFELHYTDGDVTMNRGGLSRKELSDRGPHSA